MKRFITLSVFVIISLFIVNSCKNVTKPEEIDFFPDPNFESLIREILDKENGAITESDLLNINPLCKLNERMFNMV